MAASAPMQTSHKIITHVCGLFVTPIAEYFGLHSDHHFKGMYFLTNHYSQLAQNLTPRQQQVV